jgi:integrase
MPDGLTDRRASQVVVAARANPDRDNPELVVWSHHRRRLFGVEARLPHAELVERIGEAPKVLGFRRWRDVDPSRYLVGTLDHTGKTSDLDKRDAMPVERAEEGSRVERLWRAVRTHFREAFRSSWKRSCGQQLLGHADVSTTANIYVQGSPADLEAKLRKAGGE